MKCSMCMRTFYGDNVKRCKRCKLRLCNDCAIVEDNEAFCKNCRGEMKFIEICTEIADSFRFESVPHVIKEKKEVLAYE